MEEKEKYFLVRQKAVPEVLLKVVEAKKLLESEKVLTIQEATDVVGISNTVTFVLQMDDEQGLLSDLLRIVAVYKANILTIYQSIPVNSIATLTLSVEVRSDTGSLSSMTEEMEAMEGIHYVKILARE